MRPLDDYWKQAGLGRKDFTPSAWDLTVSRGRSYGVPSSAYTIAFLWNRGLLAASGVPGDRPPDTFEALMEASSRVQRVGPAGPGASAGAEGAPARGRPRGHGAAWGGRTARVSRATSRSSSGACPTTPRGSG